MHCNPVVVSYLLITQDDVIYFISPEKVTKEVNEYLKEQHVKLKNYDEVETYLNTFTGRNILIDPKKTNFAIYSAINPKCNIIRGESPVALLKAIRNEQEIAGIHAAMQRDGVALVKFLKWLEESVYMIEQRAEIMNMVAMLTVSGIIAWAVFGTFDMQDQITSAMGK